ncbi:MAG: thioesterase family protein [Candidatus Omnitrophota bacterium]
MKARIYYHHTDAGGVVYYGRYLDFLEEARTQYLEERGVSVPQLAKQGTLFVVARQEIDYKAPAFYGDVLDIDSRITNIGAAKLEFVCEVKNHKGEVICLGKTVMVCVDSSFKPKQIPEDIRNKLS